MNILVIGGSYFIGRALVETLASNQLNNIWVLNRGTRKILNKRNVYQLIADRHDFNKLKKVLHDKKFDVVYDLSGFTISDVRKTSLILKNNVNHYIFLSTIAVCKKPNNNLPIKEEQKKCSFFSGSKYGYQKWCAEKYLFKKGEQGWFNTTTIRPTYVYGPNNYAKRENYIFDKILSGMPIIIRGDGDNIVQLGYVYDLTQVLTDIGCKESSYNKCFNFSSDEYVTINEIIQYIEGIIGKKAKIKYINKKNYNTDDTLSFPEFNWYADNTKIRKTFSLKNDTKLLEGLAITYKNYLNSNNTKLP